MNKEDKSIDILLKEYSNGKINKVCLRRYLCKMSDQQIITAVGMAEMSKIIWLLEIKHKRKAQLIPVENDVMLRVADTNVSYMSYLAVYIHFLILNENILQIEGNVSIPASIEQAGFYVRANGIKIVPEFENCGLDLWVGNNLYEKRIVFRTKIPLEENGYKLEFFNEVNGTECRYRRINAMRFSPVNDAISGQYCNLGDWIIRIDGNSIVCSVSDESEIVQYETEYQSELKKIGCKTADKAVQLRQRYFKAIKNKRKPIWVIMDRSNRADDSGEAFFRYMKKHPEIDTYFILDRNCNDYQRLQEYGNVVSLYSDEHYLLVLMADCVISSQCNGVVENPFWNEAEYYRDLYHKPKIIFLQHGVIKDDMSVTLNRFNTNIKGFVTSTYKEYQSILKFPYYYREKNVWLTGLPVFDALYDNRQKMIVFAPTWRKGLMHQEWDKHEREMRWLPVEDISKSEYFQRYRSIFCNEKVQACCKKNGYKIVFKPHPLMQSFIETITQGTEVVFLNSETSYHDLFAWGNLLVTDYSSLAFEFAYLDKSTLYYQFDRKEFFSSHTYCQGYFDYEKEGFGEVFTSEKKLVQTLIEYIENDCVTKAKYRKRMDSLYPYHGGACDRIYERIKNLLSEE